MHKACAITLSFAAWLASSVVLAQPVSAPDAKTAPLNSQATVTVQAQPTERAIQGQTISFVRSYAAAANPNVDQIGRWHDPVCVQVLDLPLPEQAAKIKARIETVAHALGLPAASANCKPNVEIAFEDNPQKAMDGVAKRLEPLLGYYHLSRTKQLKTINHPIQAWYVTATNSDAVNVAGLIGSGLSPTLFLGAPKVVDDPDPDSRTPPGCVSHFASCYVSSFYNVLIVADNRLVAGNRLSLLADDMVMLSLTQPRSLDGCNALSSVIDRFAKSPCPNRDPPDGLTPADTAYLTALYSADLEAKKSTEQWAIANHMAKILMKAEAVAAASEVTSGSQPAHTRSP